AGREVVQVYSEAAGEDASRPVRVLAGFATVTAAPGERVEATIALHPRTFMGYDEEAAAWQRQSGAYTMRAGRSSRDLRLAAGIVVRWLRPAISSSRIRSPRGTPRGTRAMPPRPSPGPGPRAERRTARPRSRRARCRRSAR